MIDDFVLSPERNSVRKGRGAVNNPTNRFDTRSVIPIEEDWTQFSEEKVSVKTRLHRDKTKKLITTNKSPDLPFTQSINPYKGCEHGCIYCFARPTHSYLDLSPGLDFETEIFYKTNVVDHLRKAFSNPRYEVTPIALGTNTDPYQPAETQLGITRKILETLLEYRHPVTILTKSTLILRDMDLLRELKKFNLVTVSMSVTSLDNRLKTILEPRAAAPAARIRVLRDLVEEGIPTGAVIAPIIPFINDQELEHIVGELSPTGISNIGYIVLRLPLELEDLFRRWLQEHFPQRLERVMNRVRDLHGGNSYRSQWGERMKGVGVYSELLQNRFEKSLRKNGLDGCFFEPLRCDLFRNRGFEQIALF